MTLIAGKYKTKTVIWVFLKTNAIFCNQYFSYCLISFSLSIINQFPKFPRPWTAVFPPKHTLTLPLPPNTQSVCENERAYRAFGLLGTHLVEFGCSPLRRWAPRCLWSAETSPRGRCSSLLSLDRLMRLPFVSASDN